MLEKIIHLQDIDEIWNKTEDHANKLDSLAQQNEDTLKLVHSHQNGISELAKYKKSLCDITHLNDVDEIWNSNEIHSEKLSELQKQNGEINNLIQNNKDHSDTIICDVIKNNNATTQTLNKKINYAYLIAGGSLGLALIELIIILLKVI